MEVAGPEAARGVAAGAAGRRGSGCPEVGREGL